KTYSVYQNSESLHYLQKSIQAFEKVNKVKYYTDFKEFVFESSVEDFCDLTGADVVVSTIHKSKGREFDNVYMLIDALRHIQDSELRSYYVGMTRAKQSLLIHTNGTLFNRIPADRHYVDQNQYEMPSEVVLQLSLKDVNLGFFRNLKKEILALRAGNKLRFENNYLYHTPTNRCIGQLSKKMQEELCKWTEKGYQVADAKVRFIVAWRPKDAPKEENTAIILPDLILRKT
ncbi:MAG: 3'-5' exonuclease, partial [Sodaliphilus sp.]|nr:3'-5' exonuclease [Sodaliphilus sp.]